MIKLMLFPLFNSIIAFMKKHRIKLFVSIFLIVGIIATIIIGCYFIINPYKKFVIASDKSPTTSIGMVLGAGVANSGQPYRELRARLDTAADAINNGKVNKLILSGDNRFLNYDEPTAMYNYLIDKRGISANKLQRDFAGRSTYESCERAIKIFEVTSLIIFSADSHLPRAIYLCRHFGIEAYGIGSGVEANNSSRRELLARVKAVYNAEFVGEKTVLGDRIPLN
jgi:vancomycin permeability regulator SanA